VASHRIYRNSLRESRIFNGFSIGSRADTIVLAGRKSLSLSLSLSLSDCLTCEIDSYSVDSIAIEWGCDDVADSGVVYVIIIIIIIIVVVVVSDFNV
jgi:hypothetical protein